MDKVYYYVYLKHCKSNQTDTCADEQSVFSVQSVAACQIDVLTDVVLPDSD